MTSIFTLPLYFSLLSNKLTQIGISCTLKDSYYYCVITTHMKKITLASRNRLEMAKWVVTLDAMLRPEFGTIISTQSTADSDEKHFSKEQLLSLLYKEPFGSGRMLSETYLHSLLLLLASVLVSLLYFRLREEDTTKSGNTTAPLEW